jgi:hypothetical protein
MLLLKLDDYYLNLEDNRVFTTTQLEFEYTIIPEVKHGLYLYEDTLFKEVTPREIINSEVINAHLWYLVYIFDHSDYNVYDAYNPSTKFNTLISINHEFTLPTRELTFFILGPFIPIGYPHSLHAYQVQTYTSLHTLSQLSITTTLLGEYNPRLAVRSTKNPNYYGFGFIQLPLLDDNYTCTKLQGTRCPNCCIAFQSSICPICDSDLSGMFMHNVFKYNRLRGDRYTYYFDYQISSSIHLYSSLCFQIYYDIYYINYNQTNE